MADSLSEPLIEKSDEDWEEPTKQTRRWPRGYILSLILHLLTICLLPVAYFTGYHRGSAVLPRLPTHGELLSLWRFTRSAADLRTVVSGNGYGLKLQKLDDEFFVEDDVNKKFQGLPRPELDDAWDGLLEHMNIRVHPDEAQRSNFTSIELNDGSGDVAGLPTVFHSLHCLKTLRRTLFPESYPDDWEIFKPPFPGGIGEHVDHCLENLRQSIMCQGDLSLYRYKWLPTQDMPKPLAHMDHVCVDWDHLMEWAAERSFSIHDGLLTNPHRGTWQPHEHGTA
ncbi:hypothetical protein GQ53DRAFT_650157 [Thozetella sp. PMI_491]|nr:hypothetical protein GQ53DRAFT_650157 [Thozetella sp. PMI_491]